MKRLSEEVFDEIVVLVKGQWSMVDTWGSTWIIHGSPGQATPLTGFNHDALPLSEGRTDARGDRVAVGP